MKVYPRVSRQIFSCTTASLLLLLSVFAYVGCQPDSAPEETVVEARPHVRASNAVEAGRYLAIIAGCNDCHTDGYLFNEGRVPEENWLTGSPLGWRGPWGTTYAPNLRLRVQEITEDAWVSTLHTRTALPPMTWMNANKMSEQDARALYQYIKSLGPKGEVMPVAVSPERKPATPYILLEPLNTKPPQE